MKTRFTTLLLAAFVLTLAGCRSLESIAPLPADPAATAGRQVLLQKCSTCHNLEPIDAHPTARWEKILPRMSKEAKLSESEATSVRDYVMGVRATMDQPRVK